MVYNIIHHSWEWSIMWMGASGMATEGDRQWTQVPGQVSVQYNGILQYIVFSIGALYYNTQLFINIYCTVQYSCTILSVVIQNQIWHICSCIRQWPEESFSCLGGDSWTRPPRINWQMIQMGLGGLAKDIVGTFLLLPFNHFKLV